MDFFHLKNVSKVNTHSATVVELRLVLRKELYVRITGNIFIHIPLKCR